MIPCDQWNNMTDEERRLHHIRVRAYFLYLKRKEEGRPGTPEGDWCAAEAEYDRKREINDIWRKACGNASLEGRAYLFTFYYLALLQDMWPRDIKELTPLPSNPSLRKQLGKSVGLAVMKAEYKIPDDVTTFGALVKALKKAATPDRSRHTIRWP